MLVKLLKSTNYHGFKEEGTTLDVPFDVAKRWSKNRIAEAYSPDSETKTSTDIEIEKELLEDAVEELEAPVEVAETEPNLDELSAKELYKICCEKGLEAEPKRSKEYYLELLTTS